MCRRVFPGRYATAVPRFYVTTPIYYVNDVPHIGPRLHDGDRRRPGPLAPAASATTSSSSPAPTSTGRRSPGRRRRTGLTPQEWVDQHRPRGSPRPGPTLDISNDDFIRTTEPRHHGPSSSSCGRIHDNGYIYKDAYRGLYCVSCEEYNEARTSSSTASCCPIHRHPGRDARGGELLLPAESPSSSRLLEWYDGQPDAVRPSRSATRPSASSRAGLEDISITRTSIDWGVAGALGRRPRLLRLVRRADQLPHRHRLRRGPGAIRRAGGRPSTT